MRVLAVSTGLLDVLVVVLHRTQDGLPVSNLWFPNLYGHPELALQPLGDDLDVELSHSGDDDLSGLGIALHEEGRIFVGQSAQSSPELLCVGPAFGRAARDYRSQHRQITALEA